MTKPPMTPGLLLSLMKPSDPGSQPNGNEVKEPQPLTPLRGTPYTVYRCPSIRGSLLLIGYDGHGDVMLEFRIPERLYSKQLVRKMERTLREYDPGPHLALT